MVSALAALVAACEEAFGANTIVAGEHFDDDEDVSVPPTGITFGMIRRARAELTVAGVPA